jgi:hypothetical protein
MIPVISELLSKAKNEDLYVKIIQQLNKDFLLANVSYSFSEKLNPLELKNDLSKILYKMITDTYDSYLNFIYRVDLSEKELAIIGGKPLEQIIEDVTYLILKREYQKVWFRNTI